jgi:hypothetical protein
VGWENHASEGRLVVRMSNASKSMVVQNIHMRQYVAYYLSCRNSEENDPATSGRLRSNQEAESDAQGQDSEHVA